MPDYDPDLIAVIEALCARYPDVPFLTLGQTVLWDEPLKAAFCRILEEVAPQATIVAGVHDTDYFAKLPHLEDRTRKFVLVPHNDGDTRGLWSAAGELSCLFGSETVPTRALLTENGVAFDKVARQYPGGIDNLLKEQTEAWGWRAIVHTEPRPLIAADVKLEDIAPALLEQLAWGFGESRRFLDRASRPEGEKPDAGVRIEQWVREYTRANPHDTLSDLYRWLTPRLWVMVRGQGACNLQTTTSLQLFRFNKATATLPRFRFVDLFLNSGTRDIARRCYDDAVRGSGIYTLHEFGDGALPFDVVIPGRGRGTLRLHDGSLYIKTEEPITLCTGCDCGSVEQLAEVLEDKFGAGVALVGKAVALISMLAHEFIFVFHERASAYTSRTQAMNNALRQAGVNLNLHPMLRLRHATWNALEGMDGAFNLPPHLATAFGTERIEIDEFATRWENVCDEQDKLRTDLKACQSPRDLLALLAREEASLWTSKLHDYTAARDAMTALREQTEILQREAEELRQRAKAARERACLLEHEKGDHFRSNVQPLRERIADLKEAAYRRLTAVGADGNPVRLSREEKAAAQQQREQEEREIATLREQIIVLQPKRRHYDDEIAALRSEARQHRQAAQLKTRQRIELERSESAIQARLTLGAVEYEAELERLHRVRDAIIVSHSLRYTNFRPTAWWLPLVSPDGNWFKRLTQTATARLEEL